MDSAPATPPPATPSPYSTMPAARPAQRPTGVTVLAVLGIIFGALGILGGLAAMAGGAFLGAMGGAAVGVEGAALGGLVMVAGFVALASGVLGLVGGIGLLQGKRWGWYLALAWAAFNVLSGLLNLVMGNIFGALVSLAIGGLVAWYLLSPAIQAWFGVSHNVPWTYKQSAA